MKTYYIGHDDKYKRLKKEGKTGWSSEADIKEMIGYLERFLQADYAPKKGKLLELGCGADGE